MTRTITFLLDTNDNFNCKGFVMFGSMTQNKWHVGKRMYDIVGTYNNINNTLKKFNFALDTKCDGFFEMYVNHEWEKCNDKQIMSELNVTLKGKKSNEKKSC